MMLKKKFKWIRRCEVDFWGVRYTSPRRTKFFVFLKKLMRYRIWICKFFRRKYDLDKPGGYNNKHNRLLKFGNFPYVMKKKKRLTVNYYMFFGRRSVRKCLYIYHKKTFFQPDYESILLGLPRYKRKKTRYFRPKKKKFFERRNHYFKMITNFYNHFNFSQLKKTGYKASKARIGCIIQFFQLLESRLDSICLRFNIGNRSYIRHFVKSRNIMVNNRIIDNLNYVVKESSLIDFPSVIKRTIYLRLKVIIMKRLFYAQPPFYYEINYRLLVFILIPTLIHPTFVPYPFKSSRLSVLATGLHTILWGCF